MFVGIDEWLQQGRRIDEHRKQPGLSLDERKFIDEDGQERRQERLICVLHAVSGGQQCYLFSLKRCFFFGLIASHASSRLR